MDFARKILQSYGWKEGDGLGKNKDGIAKPLRATLKFDKAGFGVDQAAADFNNHWWERVFNEAATNVNITQEGEQIKMSLKDEKSVEISTKEYSIKKLKKLKEIREERSENKNVYDNFLKVATLTNVGTEVENVDKINTNDIELSKLKVLTDEELFKACGGRTAHKGARHCLKLSGKLLRIEQQEAELLAKITAKRICVSEDKQIKNTLKNKCSKDEENRKECVKKKKKQNKAVEEKNEIYGSFNGNLKIKKYKTETGEAKPGMITVKKKNKSSKKNGIVKNYDVELFKNEPILQKHSEKLKKKYKNKTSDKIKKVEQKIKKKKNKKYE